MPRKQLNIRSDEAASRAALLARRLGKTTTEVVEEASRVYENSVVPRDELGVTPDGRTRYEAILEIARETVTHVKPGMTFDETRCTTRTGCRSDGRRLVGSRMHRARGGWVRGLRVVMADAPGVIGAPAILETKMVLSALAPKVVDAALNGLMSRVDLSVVDFTPAMADAAVEALRRFGKGRGHPARLNVGDRMAHSVAKVPDAPLLYEGDDFTRTDIEPALRR